MRLATFAVVMLVGTVPVQLASEAYFGDLGQNSVWGAEQAAADAVPVRPGVIEIKLGVLVQRVYIPPLGGSIAISSPYGQNTQPSFKCQSA